MGLVSPVPELLTLKVLQVLPLITGALSTGTGREAVKQRLMVVSRQLSVVLIQ
jgi:hypothetical protein